MSYAPYTYSCLVDYNINHLQSNFQGTHPDISKGTDTVTRHLNN